MFDKAQRIEIRSGFENGLSFDQVATYARPEMSGEERKAAQFFIEKKTTEVGSETNEQGDEKKFARFLQKVPLVSPESTVSFSRKYR